VLYNSIYRFDNELLLNCHAYGAPAFQSPVLHYRRFDAGRLFQHYMMSFDRVWAAASSRDQAISEEVPWAASTI
jgi:hypothetical protein